MTPRILSTLKTYSRADFGADLLAGLSVALVALPLSLAIAIASGAAPATGIITAVIGGVLISALGGSRVQVGGPTGAFIVVVYDVIAHHGYDGLVLATLMAGAMLVVAGFARAGSLIRYVPEPVIDGFTLGIAVVIGVSQLGDLFGLQLGKVPADLSDKLPALWAARDTFSGASLAVGLGAIVLIAGLRRAFPRWPGLIVALALASAAGLWAGGVETIEARFGALSAAFPAPHLPAFDYARIIELLPSAAVIAFLAGIEALLSAMVADRMIGDRHKPNAEVLAQGAANLGSALFGGLPATGAIARTATNVRAGARTPVAGIVHALAIWALVALAAPLIGQLAMPALAGLLLLTAWNMSEPHKWRHRLALRRSDQVLLGLTMALTVLADLTVAIGVGVALGLMLRMRRRDLPPSDWQPPKH
ncbi:MAG: SulP family inorganic anion transporter [Paracoccaceae bacterium]